MIASFVRAVVHSLVDSPVPSRFNCEGCSKAEWVALGQVAGRFRYQCARCEREQDWPA